MPSTLSVGTLLKRALKLGHDIRRLPSPAPPSDASQTGLPESLRGGFMARPLASTHPLVRRVIKWNPESKQRYPQNPEGLLSELASEFFWVKREVIEAEIVGVDKRAAKWTPYQAYLGIKRYLREKYPLPPSEIDLGETTITKEEAEWYFLSNFKTQMEAVIDDKWAFKFVNTPDDNHAEDNMMGHLDKFIIEKGWDKDFSVSHTLVITINNSPCRRCAKRIYDWDNRDIFDILEIRFANMYEKETGFTEATTRLRSGGVVINLISVVKDLIPLISKEDKFKKEAIAERLKKDTQAASDWQKWQQHN